VVRRVVGAVALAVGTFLLVAAALGLLWAPSHAQRTPLDVNTTTVLSGTAAKLDPATGKVESLPVKAFSTTKSDDNVSDDDVVAFVNTSCLVIDRGDIGGCVTRKDPRLINAGDPDTFAADRHTALAVNNAKYLAADSQPHQGLTNKWPFHARKTTYPFWNGQLDKAVPATYAGTEKVGGLTTYRYSVTIPRTRSEVVKGLQGFYTARDSVWVEPRTGAIIKQSQDETRTQVGGGPLLSYQLTYTPQTVSAAADKARTNINNLRLVTTIVPIVGLVVGLPLVALGLFLLLAGGRGRRRAGAHAGQPEPRGRISLAK
jgi:hypothetical protein